jgi:glycosyltransferase involved in cell wall biosynthesis
VSLYSYKYSLTSTQSHTSSRLCTKLFIYLMRVLHVLPSLAPSYGGPSAALIGLSHALSARGVYSETITTDLGCDGKMNIDDGRLIKSYGINVRYFSRLFSHWLPHDFAFSPRLARWLRAHVKEYDIVNIHGVFNYPNSVAASIARRAGIPYVIRPCGMLDPWCLEQSRLKKRAYLRLFENRVLRNAAAISFTTEEESRVAYKVSPSPDSVIIPLGVNSIEDAPRDPNPPAPQSDKKIILFLSRLDPKKGLDLLLPALVRLKGVRDDFICVIAGGGRHSYEEHIKGEVKLNNIENVVQFAGFVKGRQKQQLLQTAACFVLPSYQENFGVAVAEAMSVGCPVVISDRVNIHREVSAAGAGRVIRCDSVELFHALNALLSDETSRRVMGSNGQALVREKYTWDRISQTVLSLYETCVRRHHGHVSPDFEEVVTEHPSR